MDEVAPQPSFGEASRVWLQVGLLSFGGPAAQIALMHRAWSRRSAGSTSRATSRRSTSACCCPVPRPCSSRPMSAGGCTASRAAWQPACCSCCRARLSCWRCRCLRGVRQAAARRGGVRRRQGGRAGHRRRGAAARRRRSLKGRVEWADRGRRVRRHLLPGRAVPADRARRRRWSASGAARAIGDLPPVPRPRRCPTARDAAHGRRLARHLDRAAAARRRRLRPRPRADRARAGSSPSSRW